MRWTQALVDQEAAIRDAFFAAMMAGYAGETSAKRHISALPCSKLFDFERGEYKVCDTYFTAEGSMHSSGMTIIWHKGQPVWTMYYQGWYEPEAIPLLKQALRANYERGVFLGGRGPKVFSQGSLKYQNTVNELRAVFHNFEGEEEVAYISGPNEPASATRVIGRHIYMGMMYLPSKDFTAHHIE